MFNIPHLYNTQAIIMVALVSALITFAVAYFYVLKDMEANKRLGTATNLGIYSGAGVAGTLYFNDHWGPTPVKQV